MRASRVLIVPCVLAAWLAALPAPAETFADLCARTAKDGNVAACEAALAANRQDLDSRRHLARAYLARNDYENTVRVHGEIVALAPHDPASHFDFAAALAAFWRIEEAVEPLAVALRLRPDHGPTLRLAAILYDANRRDADAFAVIRRASELGDPLQMFELSARYRDGRGTPADADAALHWLNRAAEHGHVTAMLRLRDIYRTGSGTVAADSAKAAYWDDRQRREGAAEQ